MKGFSGSELFVLRSCWIPELYQRAYIVTVLLFSSLVVDRNSCLKFEYKDRSVDGSDVFVVWLYFHSCPPARIHSECTAGPAVSTEPTGTVVTASL